MAGAIKGRCVMNTGLHSSADNADGCTRSRSGHPLRPVLQPDAQRSAAINVRQTRFRQHRSNVASYGALEVLLQRTIEGAVFARKPIAPSDLYPLPSG